MNIEDLLKELSFKAIRSSGAGGQHVNKVSSKVELTFDLEASTALTEDEKSQLKQSLGNRLTKDYTLLLYCDESRSQHKNKDLVISRFKVIIRKGLEKPKKRKKTKPSIASVKKRLEKKRRQSAKKSSRKKPDVDT